MANHSSGFLCPGYDYFRDRGLLILEYIYNLFLLRDFRLQDFERFQKGHIFILQTRADFRFFVGFSFYRVDCLLSGIHQGALSLELRGPWNLL
jgi:hypothetical protein